MILVTVDALESALGAVTGSEPVAGRISGAGGLDEVEFAELAAEVVLGVPSAHGLSSARAGVGVVAASLLASRLSGVPHAGGVSVARRLRAVLACALAVARTVVGVEDAHDVLSLAQSGSELGTRLLALRGDRVEHAIGLSGAARLSEACRFATSGASGCVGSILASGISSAGALSGVAALAHALSSGSGVDALRISVASSSGGVTVGALRAALLSVGVPLAHAVGCAVSVVVGGCAATTALVAESIPLATRVGVAGRLRGVRSDTLGDASESGGVFAERGSVASSGGVESSSFEGEASARSLAQFGTLVPHAVLIGTARFDGAVGDDAGFDALLSGEGSVALEASGAERAATLTESGALRSGHVSAGDDALSCIPVAFGVSDTVAHVEDLTAGRFADVVDGIPLAIDGVGGAGSGVIGVTETAAEIALSSGIAEGAHARVSLAVNAGAEARAGNLARGLSRIPHAAAVGEALSLAKDGTVGGAVSGGSSGSGVGDDTEWSGRALIVGSLRGNSGSDGLGAVVLALLEGSVVAAELIGVTRSGISVLE